MAVEKPSGFPRINIPNKQKDKEYHEQWIRAIVGNTLNDSYVQNYNVIAELYKMLLRGTSMDMYSHLQVAEDGRTLPAIPLSVNEIRNKMELQLGELDQRGYEIKVKAINPEATARKLEEKERLRMERYLQPIAMEAESMTGIPLQSNEYIPQSDSELDDYMELSWKDKFVTIMEAALKFIAETTYWDDTRIALFLDVLVAGYCVTEEKIVRGIPQSERVDPLEFIFDPDSNDDFFKDATYFGRAIYMPLAQAAEQYGLSEEELTEVYSKYNQYSALGIDKRTDHELHGWFSSAPSSSIKWFKTIEGVPRCLVLKACWRDYKVMKTKFEVNKYGHTQQQDVSDEHIPKKDQDKIITNKIETWHQATLVGGCIIKEWGECPNQARDLSKLAKSDPPFTVWAPFRRMGKTVSKVEQLSGLQLLKDISLYNLQLAMARAGAKGLVYDMAMKPEGFTDDQVIGWLKTTGIIPVNSKEYQMGGGGINLMKEFDLTMSDSVSQYISIMGYIDSKMASISGVTPERQGAVSTDQGLGVTQTALLQSSLVTAPYFKGFERFCGRSLNKQAKLVKLAWAGKEVFAPIIGDTGIDFLKDNIDISLDEFDIMVVSRPPIFQDRQQLERTLDLYIQSNPGDPQVLVDTLAIRMEGDLKAAIRKFNRKIYHRMKRQMEQEQMAQEQEAAAAQQQLQAQQQMAMTQMQGQLQLQQAKNQGNLQKTLATGRIKLSDRKLQQLYNQ